MLNNIIMSISCLYAKLFKDWGIIMVALIFSMRILIEFVKPTIKYIWRNIIDSGKIVADLNEDKSLSEDEISENVWEVMCKRWKQLFVYPFVLIFIFFSVYKLFSLSMQCWIELSTEYHKTILLPWIKDIHMVDGYFILPFMCLLSTVIVECYERYSKKNRIKKGVRSLVVISIMAVIELVIFCKISAGKVFIFLVLQLFGSIYKIKYDKVVYRV